MIWVWIYLNIFKFPARWCPHKAKACVVCRRWTEINSMVGAVGAAPQLILISAAGVCSVFCLCWWRDEKNNLVFIRILCVLAVSAVAVRPCPDQSQPAIRSRDPWPANHRAGLGHVTTHRPESCTRHFPTVQIPLATLIYYKSVHVQHPKSVPKYPTSIALFYYQKCFN